MSLSNQVAAIYLATVGSNNVRYRQYPAAAAGAACPDDATYAQIVTAAAALAASWIAQVYFGVPGAGITADTEEVLAVGSGGADGATVAFATLLIEQEVFATINTAVGEYVIPQEYLPIPVAIQASTRLAGRISSSVTGGMALTVGVSLVTGLGS